jgi:ADP-heptose:LPS heptosyltransferase
MRAGKVQRLLIIFPGALGDLICAGPAICAISERHREAAPELMARTELARFSTGRLGTITGYPVVRGHSIDRRETGHLFTQSNDLTEARSFFGAFSRIYSFFAANDQNFRARLRAVSGGQVEFLPFRPSGGGHIAVRYLREVGDSNANEERARSLSRIRLLPEDLARADERLKAIGLREDRFWLIFPGSGSPSKNWPAEYFAEVADRLAPQLPPLVIIGPAEAEMAPVFERRGILTLARLDLGTVAGIASRARGFAGNDSGVSHLAAASGTPGVVIFGPADPAQWRPLGRIEVLRARPLDSLKPSEVARHIVEFPL